MNKDQHFQQYGYDHYLKAPQRSQGNEGGATSQGSAFSRIRHNLMQNVSTPMGITVCLFAGVLLLSGVVFSSLSSSDGDGEGANIPVVRASLEPVREVPVERGGLDIPHQNNTILARVGQPSFQGSQADVESLLELQRREQQRAVDVTAKEQEIARAMASNPYANTRLEFQEEQNAQSHNQSLSSMSQSSIPQNLIEPASGSVVEHDEPRFSNTHEEQVAQAHVPIDVLSIPPKSQEKTAPPISHATLTLSQHNTEMEPRPFEVAEPQAPKTEDILQKVGSQQSDTDTQSDAFGVMTAAAATIQKPAAPHTQRKMHAAASSPETIDFVRSVLNDENAPSTSTARGNTSPQPLNDIAPASGAARSAVPNAGTGGYFVQLASITDQGRAPKEWSKMQSRYNMLQHVGYRTQKADLNSGTFYRIQAGPLPKSEADALCQALKKADKPGGCLVVRK